MKWKLPQLGKPPECRKINSLIVHINREKKTSAMHFTCNFGRSASSGPLGFCAPCCLKNQKEKGAMSGI